VPPEPVPGAAQVRFVLKNVVLTPADEEKQLAIPEAELRDIWASYLGQEISLEDLLGVAAEITARYRNAGYVLSRAVVPAQEITDGTARIEVVQGYVEKITIRRADQASGEEVPLEQIVTGRRGIVEHARTKILESKPLQAKVLERYMLLLNDLPGVEAQAVITGVETGGDEGTELIIYWSEDRLGGSASIDNFGTRYLGPLQVQGSVAANNLLGLQDSAQLRGLVTPDLDELAYLGLSYGVPIWNEGTQAALNVSRTWTEPQQVGDLRNLESEGDSEFISLTVSHPFIRSRSMNLSGVTGFRLQNSETDYSGKTTYRDKVRAVSAGGTFDFVDRFRGITLLGLDVAQGLDVLGATDESDSDELPGPTRLDADPEFTRFAFSFIRDQDLSGAIGEGWSVRLAALGQYSLDPLAPSEQFGVGGDFIGRGYGPYEIAGDHGVASTLQLQYGRPWTLGFLRDYVESYQAYTFLDGGITELKGGDDANGGDDRDELVSAGVGVDLNLVQQIALQLVVGQPITRDPSTLSNSDDRYPRLFFRLAKRF
jgi:hemolysin activation/secretion protein